MSAPGKPPSQGSSGQPPPPDYRQQFPRKIRTAVGAEATAHVFAAAYAAQTRMGTDHLLSLQCARQAVDVLLDVLDTDVGDRVALA